MQILKYEDTSSSKGKYISLKEAYECCCLKHKNGYIPEMFGLSYHQFLQKLFELEEASCLDDRREGAWINYDKIAY